MHIMKTAGFTTARQIGNGFPPGAVWGITPNDAVWFSRVNQYINPRVLASLPASVRAEYSAFCGHYPYEARSLMGSDVMVATVMRHPVDRTISYLKHCQRVQPEHVDRSLEAIYEDEWFTERFITNHTVKLFSLSVDEMLAHPRLEGWTDEQMRLLMKWRDDESSVSDTEREIVFRHLRPDGPAKDMYELIGAPNTAGVDVDADRFARACENLERVELLGLYDRYPAFAEELSAQLGVRLRSDLAINVGEEGDGPGPLRRRIADDNPAELELYGLACRLTARRRPAPSS